MTNPNSPAGTITGQQLAALLMLTPRRVQQLAAQGVIPRAGRDAYQLVGAVRGYLRWLDDENRRAAASASAVRLAEQRVAVIEQRIAAKMKGLIPAEDHRAVMAELVRVVRREIERVPENMPSYVRDRLRIEINRSMAVIAKAAADAAKKVELGQDVFQ